MSNRIEGTVKWFDAKKGYGFISGDSGEDLFVHYSGIVSEGFKTLEEGQRISCEITSGDKGPMAINVELA